MKKNPYLTFGGYHKEPDSKLDTYEANDEYMRHCFLPNGSLPNGITGANNGVYSAQAYSGEEIIVTKDRRIVEALAKELSFKKDVMGVTLSNGGIIIDPDRRDKWDRVCLWGDMVNKHIQNGDKLPEPKRLHIREEYEKIKEVQNKIMQNKMSSLSR